MTAAPSAFTDQFVLEREQLQKLFEVLQQHGYQIVGPTLRDNTIVYDALDSVEDLPVGYIDEQDGGHYRLVRRDEPTLFSYVVGPHSWKRFLFPPELRVLRIRRNGAELNISPEDRTDPPRLALFGARPCELSAIAIQDTVFGGDQYKDPDYLSRRANLFVVAVNCGRPGGTCFCASMGTGPKATTGFDLALTEVLEGKRHYFVVEVGTEAGAEVIEAVTRQKASKAELQSANKVSTEAAKNMGRSLDMTGIKELFYRNAENPHWDDVASRCLTCTNCTLVCPTCFCVNVEDVTDLAGEYAERWRKWDSCFTMDFSYVYGGSVRASAKSRYRQWITHKLATWQDQFGSPGCVGCGRCITWCPVGIDITKEAAAIRQTDVTATAVRSK